MSREGFVCAFCGVVGASEHEICPVRAPKRHRLVAQLPAASGLGQTVKATVPAGGNKRSGFTPASKPQQEKRKTLQPYCIHCGDPATDSMHIIPRGMHTGGQDDPRATVSGCRACHRAYDSGRLSLLEDLEMVAREELAFAVERVGLVVALQRITNARWAPVDQAGEDRAA